MRRHLPLLAAIALAGCATGGSVNDPPSKLEVAAPRSILIVPVENGSLNVDAPNYLLSTLTIPLAEKGYYVFPVNTVKVVLEQEGLYEPERVRELAPARLAGMFGADAVLYVRINRWDAQYAILATTVTVELDYRLVSKSGEELWTTRKQVRYQPQNQNSGNPLADLIVAAVAAAITRAAPNYMPLARQANNAVFLSDDTAWPPGPYARPAGAAAR
jgi:hypothetical protein